MGYGVGFLKKKTNAFQKEVKNSYERTIEIKCWLHKGRQSTHVSSFQTKIINKQFYADFPTLKHSSPRKQ